jgi:hypothetical protein
VKKIAFIMLLICLTMGTAFGQKKAANQKEFECKVEYNPKLRGIEERANEIYYIYAKDIDDARRICKAPLLGQTLDRRYDIFVEVYQITPTVLGTDDVKGGIYEFTTRNKKDKLNRQLFFFVNAPNTNEARSMVIKSASEKWKVGVIDVEILSVDIIRQSQEATSAQELRDNAMNVLSTLGSLNEFAGMVTELKKLKALGDKLGKAGYALTSLDVVNDLLTVAEYVKKANEAKDQRVKDQYDRELAKLYLKITKTVAVTGVSIAIPVVGWLDCGYSVISDAYKEIRQMKIDAKIMNKKLEYFFHRYGLFEHEAWFEEEWRLFAKGISMDEIVELRRDRWKRYWDPTGAKKLSYNDATKDTGVFHNLIEYPFIPRDHKPKRDIILYKCDIYFTPRTQGVVDTTKYLETRVREKETQYYYARNIAEAQTLSKKEYIEQQLGSRYIIEADCNGYTPSNILKQYGYQVGRAAEFSGTATAVSTGTNSKRGESQPGGNQPPPQDAKKDTKKDNNNSVSRAQYQKTIQDRCKFADQQAVWRVMDTHSSADSLYKAWAESYNSGLLQNKPNKADKDIIQDRCKFSNPQAVWNVVAKHGNPASLLQKWADSYYAPTVAKKDDTKPPAQDGKKNNNNSASRAQYQKIIQDRCKFADQQAVWRVMDTHSSADSLYKTWAESYPANLIQNKPNKSDTDIIQSMCKFSNPQAVWNVVAKHANSRSLLEKWANSYYAVTTQPPPQDTKKDTKKDNNNNNSVSRAQYQKIIQDRCKFADQQAVWRVMDTHSSADSLYKVWAESYNSGLLQNKPNKADTDIIQDRCKFSNPQAVWNVVNKHGNPKSLLQKWADSYYAPTVAKKDDPKPPPQDTKKDNNNNNSVSRAQYQNTIQARCKFGEPQGVWRVMDTHSSADSLYRVWAESYNSGLLQNKPSKSDKDIIQDWCKFSNPQAVWNVVAKHGNPNELLKKWANSYYANVNPPPPPQNPPSNPPPSNPPPQNPPSNPPTPQQKQLTRADHKNIIQARCKFGDPNNVWKVMDKFTNADALYKKWAESYPSGYLSNKPNKDDKDIIQAQCNFVNPKDVWDVVAQHGNAKELLKKWADSYYR